MQLLPGCQPGSELSLVQNHGILHRLRDLIPLENQASELRNDE